MDPNSLWTTIWASLSNSAFVTSLISIVFAAVLALAAIVNIMNSWILAKFHVELETRKIDGGFIQFDLRIINSGPATAKRVFWALVGNDDKGGMETIRAAISPPIITGERGIVVEGRIASGVLNYANLVHSPLLEQYADLSKFKSVSVFIRKHNRNWKEEKIKTELSRCRCYSEFMFDCVDGHLTGRRKVRKKLPNRRACIYDARKPLFGSK
jgi:hypothetical protein